MVLKVEHLNAGRMVRDVSFELRKGEILGFSGLMGAGRTETARALFGADPRESGDIYVEGKKVAIHSPQDAVREGIGYLSEDRKRLRRGAARKTSRKTPPSPACADYVKHLSFIDGAAERKVTQKMVNALKTKTPSVDQLVMDLSGGNQQKVVVCQMADQQQRYPDLRRADARHRRRRETGDLRTDEPAGAGREIHHHDILRNAGNPANVGPHRGDVRGEENGGVRRVGSHAGKDHERGDTRNRGIGGTAI